MKTKLLVAMLLLSLVIPVAQAQKPDPSVGVRLGMEVMFPSGGGKYYKNGAGVTLGPTVRLPFNQKFYFEPSLLFSFTGMSSKYLVEFDKDHLYQGSANLYTLRLPLEFGYVFGLSEDARMSIATGPWINFNLSARQKITPNFAAPEPDPDVKINLFKYGWKRVDAQWGIRLNFTFAEHYYVGLTTGVAFTPFASFGDKDKKIRIYRNTIAVSLGYNF